MLSNYIKHKAIKVSIEFIIIFKVQRALCFKGATFLETVVLLVLRRRCCSYSDVTQHNSRSESSSDGQPYILENHTLRRIKESCCLNMLKSRAYPVIAGVGPGTGAAIARKLALTYPVVLLARSADTLSSVSKQITDAGGQAVALEADLTNGESGQKAFQTVDEKFGQEASCAVYFRSRRHA